MTDSPAPGRHRSPRGRRSRGRGRGRIGPLVSVLSVLLAIGPVIWLMATEDGSTVADDQPSEVLTVSENNSGPGLGDTGAPATDADSPQVIVTKTLPGGVTTTLTPSGTPTLGPAESISSPSDGSATVTATPGDVATVTVTPPGAPPTTKGNGKPEPRPSTSAPTRTLPTPDTPPPPAGGGGTSAIERQVLDLTNAARRNQGCRPLQLDKSLVAASGRHASDMARRHYLDHNNPNGQGPGDRMSAAGFRGSNWGENIAAGYDTAQKVFAAWMNSDGHRANILNCRFDRIGIGYDPGQVKPGWGPGSWVQDFGRVG